MNFNDNFKQIGTFDISALKEQILQFKAEDWLRNEVRQKKFETHKDTTTIPLIFDEDFRHINPTHLPEFSLMEPLLGPLYVQIRKYYNQSLKNKRLQKKHGKAYPVRTIIARLQPKGKIPAHMDRNHSLTHGHRIHIPIITDEHVFFSVGDESLFLKEGEVWEINNRHEHYVENKSDIYRIHIIIDWAIPGERCCCSINANPQGVCSPEACKSTDLREYPCDCFN